jgi:pimeloyl-ACP methyl ester carboxylesterase
MTTNNNPVHRARGRRFWAAGALLLIAVVLAIIAGLWWVDGARAKAALRVQFPPPGQMVSVGSHKLHISCQGQGTPAVILEAGLGDFSSIWALVAPDIAAVTRVCVYDRAGMGWSQRSPAPRTAATIAEELHTLLGQAGIQGPYVLVGHSLGGLFVREYAYTYPQDVAGMVLVDSSHEDQGQRTPPALAQAEKTVYDQLKRQVLLSRLLTASGVSAREYAGPPAGSKLPQAAAQAYRALAALDSASLETTLAEHDKIEESSNQVRAARTKTLGDMPLIVLSHGQSGAPSGITVPAEVEQEFERVWIELQGQLAGLSANGQRMIAAKSGHYIQLDQPDLVVTAVKQVLSAIHK